MLNILNKENIKLYLIYPFLILVLTLFIHSRVYTFDFSIKLQDYLYTSWLFSYEFGFMKRGLVGHFLNTIGISPTYENIRIISIILLLSVFYLLYTVVLKALNSLKIKRNDKTLILFSIMFFPFTTVQLILELSRFDQIGQLILLFFIIILAKKPNIYIPYIYLFITIILLTLIHEAALIIFIPLMICLFHLQYKNNLKTIFVITFTLISILFISIFGVTPPNHINLFIDHYQNIKGIDEYAFRTTTLSIMENIELNIKAFIQSKMYIIVFGALLIISPFLIFIKSSFNFKNNYFLFISTASPLALSIIAFDYFRWISLFLFNLTILICYLSITKKTNINLLSTSLIKYKNFIIIWGIVGLTFGPFGVTELFPHFNKTNRGALGELNRNSIPSEIRNKLNWLP